jgi:hypothetical protein
MDASVPSRDVVSLRIEHDPAKKRWFPIPSGHLEVLASLPREATFTGIVATDGGLFAVVHPKDAPQELQVLGPTTWKPVGWEASFDPSVEVVLGRAASVRGRALAIGQVFGVTGFQGVDERRRHADAVVVAADVVEGEALDAVAVVVVPGHVDAGDDVAAQKHEGEDGDGAELVQVAAFLQDVTGVNFVVSTRVIEDLDEDETMIRLSLPERSVHKILDIIAETRENLRWFRGQVVEYCEASETCTVRYEDGALSLLLAACDWVRLASNLLLTTRLLTHCSRGILHAKAGRNTTRSRKRPPALGKIGQGKGTINLPTVMKHF